MFEKLISEGKLRQRVVISVVLFGILALVLDGYLIGVNYLSVSGYGDWGVVSQELVGWLGLLGFLLIAVAMAGMLLEKFRCTSFAVLIGAVIYVALTLGSLWVSDKIRSAGFARLAREAAPLVKAIKAYEKNYGYPPKELADLGFRLPEGHVVKSGKLPEFEFLSGYLVQERYHGNPWVLMLQTPTGPLRWDIFLYYPLQNYPSLGHGGWIEPIEDWAYVHQ